MNARTRKSNNIQKIALIKLLAVFFCFEIGLSEECLYTSKMMKQSLRLSHRQVFVSTKLGFSMIIDDTDMGVSRFIKNTGIWQEPIANLIFHLVKKGDNVLNLGSQTGMQILGIARIIGQTGKIFVFEPSSISYSIMRKNLFLNGFGDISTTYKIGASNKFQTGKLFINTQNTGASRIGRLQNYSKEIVEQKYSQETANLNQKVVLASVDSVLAEDIIIDFALIDVQSMEIQAIDGMRRVIDRSPNLIILSEWQYGLFQSIKSFQLFKAVVEYLFQKGYRIYQIFPTPINCNIPKLIQKTNVTSLIMRQDTNVLMIPPTVELPSY